MNPQFIQSVIDNCEKQQDIAFKNGDIKRLNYWAKHSLILTSKLFWYNRRPT